MGIRYYAYAFDSHETATALADPRNVIGADPLADAWGMEPGFSVGVISSTPQLPERDLLYLDKAWPHLQHLTASNTPGARARPAHLMFRVEVEHTSEGWIPWAHTITPAEAIPINEDLRSIAEGEVEPALKRMKRTYADLATEVEYALHFLRKAQAFTAGVVADGRGFAYTIG